MQLEEKEEVEFPVALQLEATEVLEEVVDVMVEETFMAGLGFMVVAVVVANIVMAEMVAHMVVEVEEIMVYL